MFVKSIRAKLNTSALVFLAITVALAIIATAGTFRLNQSVEDVSAKWVVGSHTLGELSDRISEFRLAEAYRALARTSEDAAKAEHSAEEHATVIAESLKSYQELVGPEFAKAEIEAFQSAWDAYLAGHKAWVEHDNDLQLDEPALQESALHNLYKAADDASDALIDRNQEAAALESTGANQSAQNIALLVLVSALCAGLLAVLVISIVERRVTGPLAAITSALSRLASGDRDVHVPGAERADEVGAMARALEVFRSNAKALLEAQELASSLARHDPLTGLPNRRLFASELKEAVNGAEQGGDEHAVMLIDLDRFKPINDLHGHAAGDFVLCEVAKRLSDLVAGAGLVARLGGDEFVILMRSLGERKQRDQMAIRLAGKVVSALSEPFANCDLTVQIGASIGIALYPEDGADAEAILRAADLAMYRAKQDGRSTFRFFEQSMDEELRSRAALESDLRQAIEAGEIRPYFQPLVSITDEKIRGFEVLARWEHATRGFVSPDVFIPLIEQLGLMSQFTSVILKQACREARDWDPEIYLAVNISPAQFQDPVLPLSVIAALDATGFPPSRLELEVTESALVGDMEKAKKTLSSLQVVGIRVALDDFGTGYSSLYHLRELKFDKIKIDRSFVRDMEGNNESRKIVDAVLGLARSLDMPAVAEGIEDEPTMRMLADRGCAFGQGFFFSRAVPAEGARQMLAGNAQPAKANLASW